MSDTYRTLTVSDRIDLNYTIGEDQKRLRIMARRIEPVEPLRSSILNLQWATFAERYEGCSWSGDYYGRMGNDIGSGPRSYFQYLTDVYADPDQAAALMKINSLIDELDEDSTTDMSNVLTVSADDTTQFYDRTAGGTKSNGQIMEYTDANAVGTCRLAFYIETTYTPDPVSMITIPGLFNIKPDPEALGMTVSRSGFSGTYSTEDPPLISFWSAPVLMDDEVGDGDHYGETVQCLIVILRNPNNTAYAVHTILSLNMFESAEITDDPTTDDPAGTVTPSGWVGAWDYTSDSDSPQPVTGYDFVNRWQHGIRLYYISDVQAESFMNALWSMTLSQAIDLAIDSALFRANVDFIRGVICLHKLPVTVSTYGTSPLTIMGYDLSAKFSGLSAFKTVSGTYGSVLQITSDPLTVPYTYGDTVFMDWDSCRAMVRLPFVGTVPIDIKSCRGGSIYVSYNVDVLTGNLIAQIFCTNAVSGATILLYQGSGNCALPIPYSGNTEGAFKQLGSVAGIAGGIAAAAAGGNPADALTIGSSMQYGQNTGSYTYTATEAASMTDLTCKLIITGNVPVIPPLQRAIEGYRAATTAKISSFVGTGFLSGTVHADFSGATAEELEEIERQFETGVII